MATGASPEARRSFSDGRRGDSTSRSPKTGGIGTAATISLQVELSCTGSDSVRVTKLVCFRYSTRWLKASRSQNDKATEQARCSQPGDEAVTCSGRSCRTDVRKQPAKLDGLTLVEVLMAISILGILAALLLSVLRHPRASARRSVCMNHVRQIGLGVRMYADDLGDAGPSRSSGNRSLDGWTACKQLMKSYVGQNTGSSPEDRLFTCPADSYHYDFTPVSTNAYAYVSQGIYQQAWSDYSSYGFNGGNTRSNRVTGVVYPGIAGRKLSSIQEPSRTILLSEIPAYYGFSWHNPENPKFPHYFNHARNMAAFVDGHVSYLKFFWDASRPGSESWEYDPPAGYDYKWSAN